MPITRDSLRSDLRAMFQNIAPAVMADEALDLAISEGLSRLNRDRADEKTYTISATGKRFVLSTLVSDWVPGFSLVRQVFVPVPSTTGFENAEPLDMSEYREQKIGNEHALYIHRGVTSDAMVVYTTTWKIQGIDDATATTLVDTLRSAMRFIAAHHVAVSMASKMAGSNDRQAPADFVNMGSTKSDQYRRLAGTWEQDYLAAMNLSRDKPKGIAATRPHSFYQQDGSAYLTHRGMGQPRYGR